MEKNIGKDKKEYINVNCWCDIEMGVVYQPRLVDNQNQQPQLENTQMETPNFSDEFGIDDSDLHSSAIQQRRNQRSLQIQFFLCQ